MTPHHDAPLFCLLADGPTAPWLADLLLVVDDERDVVLTERVMTAGELAERVRTVAGLDVVLASGPLLTDEVVEACEAARATCIVVGEPHKVTTEFRRSEAFRTLPLDIEVRSIVREIRLAASTSVDLRSLATDLVSARAVVPAHPLYVVTGPPGAPGRTTVAVWLAAISAVGGNPHVLVDMDLSHPTVAYHNGVTVGRSVWDWIAVDRRGQEGLRLEDEVLWSDAMPRVQGSLLSSRPNIPYLPGATSGWEHVPDELLRQRLRDLREKAPVIVDSDPGVALGGARLRRTLFEEASAIAVVLDSSPIGLRSFRDWWEASAPGGQAAVLLVANRIPIKTRKKVSGELAEAFANYYPGTYVDAFMARDEEAVEKAWYRGIYGGQLGRDVSSLAARLEREWVQGVAA